MLNFNFSWKGLGLASSPHFVYYFPSKIFMLYFKNWPNFIVWLPLLLEILVNIFIVIISCPVCNITNFGINLSFIDLFFYTTKTSEQKCKYLKTKKELSTWNKRHFLETESPTFIILSFLFFYFYYFWLFLLFFYITHFLYNYFCHFHIF